MISFHKNQTEQQDPNQDLNQILLALGSHGRPRLHCYDDGRWMATLEVNEIQHGIRLEIQSKSNHKTPLEAAILLNERLDEAMSLTDNT